MALIPCSTCGHPLTGQEVVCPACGQELIAISHATNPLPLLDITKRETNTLTIAIVASFALALTATVVFFMFTTHQSNQTTRQLEMARLEAETKNKEQQLALEKEKLKMEQETRNRQVSNTTANQQHLSSVPNQRAHQSPTCLNFSGRMVHDGTHPAQISVCSSGTNQVSGTVRIDWDTGSVTSQVTGTLSNGVIVLDEPYQSGNGKYTGYRDHDGNWKGQYQYYNMGKYAGQSYPWNGAEQQFQSHSQPVGLTGDYYTVQVASCDNYAKAQAIRVKKIAFCKRCNSVTISVPHK